MADVAAVHQALWLKSLTRVSHSTGVPACCSVFERRCLTLAVFVREPVRTFLLSFSDVYCLFFSCLFYAMGRVLGGSCYFGGCFYRLALLTNHDFSNRRDGWNSRWNINDNDESVLEYYIFSNKKEIWKTEKNSLSYDRVIV